MHVHVKEDEEQKSKKASGEPPALMPAALYAVWRNKMDVVKITGENIAEYANMIPMEYMAEVGNGDLPAIGGIFDDTPAGVIVWKTDKDNEKVVLLSLFVLPEYRRLGVASMLLSQLRDRSISFSYTAIDDRAELEPFFEAVGFDTERIDYPLGHLTLSFAEEALKQDKYSSVGVAGAKYSELGREQKRLVAEWLSQNFEQSIFSYSGNIAPSVFLIDKDAVYGCALLREEEKGHVEIDLVHYDRDNKKELIAMLNKTLSELSASHTPDTEIEMLLTTEEGKSLYEGLFGECEDSFAVISGTNQQVSVRLLR